MLAQFQLNSIEVLISKALVELYISDDKFASVNNVLREHDDMKEQTGNTKSKHFINILVFSFVITLFEA